MEEREGSEEVVDPERMERKIRESP